MSTPRASSPSISSNSTPRSTTTPLPMTGVQPGVRMPDGQQVQGVLLAPSDDDGVAGVVAAVELARRSRRGCRAGRWPCPCPRRPTGRRRARSRAYRHLSVSGRRSQRSAAGPVVCARGPYRERLPVPAPRRGAECHRRRPRSRAGTGSARPARHQPRHPAAHRAQAAPPGSARSTSSFSPSASSRAAGSPASCGRLVPGATGRPRSKARSKSWVKAAISIGSRDHDLARRRVAPLGHRDHARARRRRRTRCGGASESRCSSPTVGAASAATPRPGSCPMMSIG